MLTAYTHETNSGRTRGGSGRVSCVAERLAQEVGDEGAGDGGPRGPNWTRLFSSGETDRHNYQGHARRQRAPGPRMLAEGQRHGNAWTIAAAVPRNTCAWTERLAQTRSPLVAPTARQPMAHGSRDTALRVLGLRARPLTRQLAARATAPLGMVRTNWRHPLRKGGRVGRRATWATRLSIKVATRAAGSATCMRSRGGLGASQT